MQVLFLLLKVAIVHCSIVLFLPVRLVLIPVLRVYFSCLFAFLVVQLIECSLILIFVISHLYGMGGGVTLVLVLKCFQKLNNELDKECVIEELVIDFQ